MNNDLINFIDKLNQTDDLMFLGAVLKTENIDINTIKSMSVQEANDLTKAAGYCLDNDLYSYDRFLENVPIVNTGEFI